MNDSGYSEEVTIVMYIYIYIVSDRLKAGIVEPEETSISRQRMGKRAYINTGIVSSGVFYVVRTATIAMQGTVNTNFQQ
jgi:hypothetical protein